MAIKSAAVRRVFKTCARNGSMRAFINSPQHAGNAMVTISNGIRDVRLRDPKTQSTDNRMITGFALKGGSEYLLRIQILQDRTTTDHTLLLFTSLLRRPVRLGGLPVYHSERYLMPTLLYRWKMRDRKSLQDYFDKKTPQSIVAALARDRGLFYQMIRNFNSRTA